MARFSTSFRTLLLTLIFISVTLYIMSGDNSSSSLTKKDDTTDSKLPEVIRHEMPASKKKTKYTSLDPALYGDLSGFPLSLYIPNEINRMSDTKCAAVFSARYTTFCERMTVLMERSARKILSKVDNTTKYNDASRSGLEMDALMEYCPCMPDTLIGRQNVSGIMEHKSESNKETEPPNSLPIYLKMEPVLPGGRWSPSDCRARQRVAIIIPFRDRASHLKKLIDHLHPLLQRQKLDYTIFVVEQNEPQKIFNKGMLMNSAFTEINGVGRNIRYIKQSKDTVKYNANVTGHRFNFEEEVPVKALDDGIGPKLWGRFDCIVWHDVDMLPEDDRNMYTCSRSPRHVGVYISKFNYTICCGAIFGGATAFTPQHFMSVNGYSNEYYGWGGEDDDMASRLRWRSLGKYHYPRCVSRYTMIRHERDHRNSENPARTKAVKTRSDIFKKVGLTSLTYSVVKRELRPLYTHLLIDLPSSVQMPDGTFVPLYKRSSDGSMRRWA